MESKSFSIKGSADLCKWEYCGVGISVLPETPMKLLSSQKPRTYYLPCVEWKNVFKMFRLLKLIQKDRLESKVVRVVRMLSWPSEHISFIVERKERREENV